MRSTFKIATLSLLLISASFSVAKAEDLVRWAPNLEAAKQLASKQNKLVLIHFYGDNCPPCRALEANVFPNAQFAASVDRNYVPVKINAQRLPATARQFKVDRWPQDVIITPSGQLVFQKVSPQDIGVYTSMLSQISAKVNARTQELAANAAPPATPRPNAVAEGNAGTSRFSAPPTNVASNRQQPYAPAYNQQPQPPVNKAPVLTASNRLDDPIGRAQATLVTPNTVANSGSRFSAPPSTPPVTPASRFASPPAGVPVSSPATAPSVARNQPPIQQQPLAASTARQPSAPVAKSLPPNVALEGFCCVTLAEKTAWQEGDARWGAVHLGKVYLFATQANQKTFLADPNKYSPVLSGNDPVAFAQSGKLVEGNRNHGLAYQGSLYLFSSQQSLEQFIAEPMRYHAVVTQAMQQVNQKR
ncbi:MAG: hypothetical protein COA78_16035 [Blastopirellula sp.]|nr:MAG: hypothetical protein COA78_16035 [Blastopirellula sp.]